MQRSQQLLSMSQTDPEVRLAEIEREVRRLMEAVGLTQALAGTPFHN